MNHVIDKNFFPGWVRKSVTFTIDDGNIPMDRKFLEIVKPAGILGTFNLCSHILGYMTPEEYREFYRGYEIANHGKYHLGSLSEDMELDISDEPLDREKSDEYKVYRHAEEGVYYVHLTIRRPELPKKEKPDGWYPSAKPEAYCHFADVCQTELEEIFGKGNVRGFVYPGGKGSAIHAVEAIAKMGFPSVRKTGSLLDTTGFAMPADRGDWTYNAVDTNLLDTMAKFEAYPDDGELKFFSFGVHSKDFERDDKWDDLRTFAEKYGNRDDEFYYSTVGDIFDYEDAIADLTVTDEKIVNGSQLTLYIKVDGNPVVLAPESEYVLE